MENLDQLQGINELQTVYQERKKTLSDMERRWERPIKASKIISIIYFFLIFLSAIGGLIYGFYELGTTGKIYEYIIGVVLGVSIGIVACGVITLLLKPIFWVIRKIMLKKSTKIEEAHYELLEFHYTVWENKQNDKQIRRILRQEEKLYQYLAYERSLKIEIMRRLGWVWIATALLFMLVVLAFFLWVLALIILILGVGVALLLPSSCSSYHRSYNGSYEEESDGIFKSIYEATFGEYFELKKEHEALKIEIKNLRD